MLILNYIEHIKRLKEFLYSITGLYGDHHHYSSPSILMGLKTKKVPQIRGSFTFRL